MKHFVQYVNLRFFQLEGKCRHQSFTYDSQCYYNLCYKYNPLQYVAEVTILAVREVKECLEQFC